MASKSSRQALRRMKLDFTERHKTASVRDGALASHKRPHDTIKDVRPVRTVKDSANSMPSDGGSV